MINLEKKLAAAFTTAMLTLSFNASAEEHKGNPKNYDFQVSPDPSPQEVALDTKVFYPKNKFRSTSLGEATFYTGISSLPPITSWFLYKMRNQKISGKHLWKNFTGAFKSPPTWDSNPWYINYVGHPLFGSEAFLLARNRGYSFFESFMYCNAISALWEFGIESWSGGHPSIQDLFIGTCEMGSLLGELRFQGKNKLMEKSSKKWYDKMSIILLDPSDAAYRAAEPYEQTDYINDPYDISKRRPLNLNFSGTPQGIGISFSF